MKTEKYCPTSSFSPEIGRVAAGSSGILISRSYQRLLGPFPHMRERLNITIPKGNFATLVRNTSKNV
jgi:hypothetical protein